MTERVLRQLDRLSFLFKGLGVEYPVMRKILELKLTMDTRRIPTVLKDKNEKAEESGNKMLRSLWMYALLSLLPGMFSFMPIQPFGKVTYIMSISMFLVTSTMISDFSSVLLDLRDTSILLGLPVSPRTLSAAKAVHVTIYLALITLSLNALPIIGLGISEGILASILLVFMLAFMVMTVIFITSVLYVLVLKNFDGEKLKDLISTVQIGFTVVLTLGYQIIIRMFDLSEMQYSFTPDWRAFLMPPAWFAAPFELFFGRPTTFVVALSAMGIILPVIFVGVHLKFISPAFEKSLIRLGSSDRGGSRIYFRRLRRGHRLSLLLCRNSQERAAFRFGFSVLGTEREFKQKIYPSIALAMLFPFIFGMTYLEDQGSLLDAYAAIRESNIYLMVYFAVMILPTVVTFVGYSSHYRGAWIYRSLPLAAPGDVLSGTYKSAVVRFAFLPFVAIGLIMFFIFGLSVLPHLTIAFFNAIAVVLILLRFTGIRMPFSRSFQVAQDGRTKGTFIGMAFSGGLAGFHYGLVMLSAPWVILLMPLVQILILVPFWRRTMNISWEGLID